MFITYVDNLNYLLMLVKSRKKIFFVLVYLMSLLKRVSKQFLNIFCRHAITN